MIKSMNERERSVLIGGAVSLAIIFIIFGLIMPYQKAMDSLDKSLNQRQADLDEVRELQSQYRSLKVHADRSQRSMNKVGETTPLLAFLEEMAGAVGGRENLVVLRPLPVAKQGSLTIESTEIKLERIGLDQVLSLLYEIEQARPPVRVDQLHLKQRFDDASQLDVGIKVSSARSQ